MSFWADSTKILEDLGQVSRTVCDMSHQEIYGAGWDHSSVIIWFKVTHTYLYQECQIIPPLNKQAGSTLGTHGHGHL
jgi:hypothetical protein